MSINSMVTTHNGGQRRRAMRMLWPVVLAIACAAGCGSDEQSDPPQAELEVRAAFDTWIDSVQSGDLETFQSVVCAETFDENYADASAPEFDTSAKQAVDESGIFVVDWYDSVSIEDDKADIVVTGHRERVDDTAPGIDEERKTAALVVEDGSWKVCSEPQDDPATARKREQLDAQAEVQTVVEAFFTAIAERDLAGVNAQLCPALRTQLTRYGESPISLGQQLGETVVSFDDTIVNVDVAKSYVTTEGFNFVNSVVFALTSDGGRWTVCQYSLLEYTKTG